MEAFLFNYQNKPKKSKNENFLLFVKKHHLHKVPTSLSEDDTILYG
jgi:hypothetical protein